MLVSWLARHVRQSMSRSALASPGALLTRRRFFGADTPDAEEEKGRWPVWSLQWRSSSHPPNKAAHVPSTSACVIAEAVTRCVR
jgi:hypothetical protein